MHWRQNFGSLLRENKTSGERSAFIIIACIEIAMPVAGISLSCKCRCGSLWILRKTRFSSKQEVYWRLFVQRDGEMLLSSTDMMQPTCSKWDKYIDKQLYVPCVILLKYVIFTAVFIEYFICVVLRISLEFFFQLVNAFCTKAATIRTKERLHRPITRKFIQST